MKKLAWEYLLVAAIQCIAMVFLYRERVVHAWDFGDGALGLIVVVAVFFNGLFFWKSALLSRARIARLAAAFLAASLMAALSMGIAMAVAFNLYGI